MITGFIVDLHECTENPNHFDLDTINPSTLPTQPMIKTRITVSGMGLINILGTRSLFTQKLYESVRKRSHS